jgi:copper transport protein
MRIYKLVKWFPFLLLLIGLMLVSGLTARTASAHASLVQAVPEANSHLSESPSVISVTFNEQLDTGLYYIKVLDHKGSAVTNQSAKMNAEQTGLELELPKLPDGIYLVSYHVISGDGHPVGGSYPITIGNPPLSSDSPTVPSATVHQHGGAQSLTVSSLMQYLARGLWYFTLLALTGWVVWLRIPKAGGAESRQSLAAWTLNLQRAHFVALLLLIFTHMEDLIGGGGTKEIWELFTGTGIGFSWILMLGLSLLGFLVLQRFAWVDVLWAFALLAVKSGSGHAVAFSPRLATIPLDFIHLAAAALWVGGLLLLAVKWRKKEANTSVYVRTFSNMAFISIVVLTLSGSASILLFLPKLRYLLDTQWGILMLVKIGVVLLVIGIAAMLRVILKKQGKEQAQRWIKVDFSLMLVIVILVGFITYTAPVPSNEPLQWHVMGDTVHMTTNITPKVQGTNTFSTKIWLPEKMGKAKQVLMILHYEDDKQVAPIQVPLEASRGAADEPLFGFTESNYKAVGPYLPFRGQWSVEVRVMDQEDNETVYNKPFIVY